MRTLSNHTGGGKRFLSKALEAERKRAQGLADLTGEAWYLFKVPYGTAAYEHGIRFGSYRHSDRIAYERDGANPLMVVNPKGHEVNRDCPCDSCDAWFRAHGDEEG